MSKTKISKNVVEGPMGLKMPESTARQIEELSKGLPRDFEYRRIAKSASEFACDPGERTDVSVITTDAIDRDGEVVLPGGIDWSGYNRIVTFAHRYDELPAGSNWWIRSKGNGLVAKTHYPNKPADWGDAPWLPSAILHLMQQPVPTCTGKSIGFMPLSIRAATPSEKAMRPELDGVPIIDKAAGIEYAVAPVPCNSDAEMQAVSKGIKDGIFDQKTADLIKGAMKSTSDQNTYLDCLMTIASYGPIDLPETSRKMQASNSTVAMAIKYLMGNKYIRDVGDGSFVATDEGIKAMVDAMNPKEEKAESPETKAIAVTRKKIPGAMDAKGVKADIGSGADDLEPLERLYVQYLKDGDTFTPVGDIELQPTLQKFAYRIVPTWSGVQFVKMRPQTDELYYFENGPMKETLGEIDKFWEAKPDYDKLGLKHNRGVLLYGPPGTGKTSILHQTAKMIIDRGDVVFYANRVSSVIEGLKSFRDVEPDRKVVVALEDADEYAGYEERDFLQLLDGETSISGVLYLASTNYIDRFPPRLMRSGRFDKKVFVPPPPVAGRQAYLARKLDGVETPEKIADLARKTEGMNFGDLKELVTAVYINKESVDVVISRLRGPGAQRAKSLTQPIALMTKDASTSESNNAAGGAVVSPENPAPQQKPNEGMPVCPKCGTSANVELVYGEAGSLYKCQQCGERFPDTKDDEGGEMTEAMKAATPADKEKSSVGATEMRTDDKDVTCPTCHEKATAGAEVEVPGLGKCDTYTCAKCGYKFIAPQVAPQGPNISGDTAGTKPAPDADYVGAKAVETPEAAPAPQAAPEIKTFVTPEALARYAKQQRMNAEANLAKAVATRVTAAIDRHCGRI